MKTSDFDYHLPEELIAQHPLNERVQSRLMSVNRTTQAIKHHHFKDLSQFVRPNDILVLNDTKVIRARLWGCKETGGQFECLVERILDDKQFLAHVRASKTPKVGTRMTIGNNQLEMVARCDELFKLKLLSKATVADLLQQYGHLPLPPYINRQPDTQDDVRYQTVFGEHCGAVAAPTAGLHFDEHLLAQIKSKIDIAYVTLHIGAGTFQPVRAELIENHHMHFERAVVPKITCDLIRKSQARNGRVIAVGTTVVRSLETAARSGELLPFVGETDLFIYPGFNFQCVDALITNFHLSQSSLLMLVSAFAGHDLMFNAYQTAVEQQYRFFSYGDAMLII